MIRKKANKSNYKNAYLILGILLGVVLVFCVSTYIFPQNNTITGFALDESKFDSILLCSNLPETKSCTPKPTGPGSGQYVCGSGSVTHNGKKYNTPAGITGDTKCASSSDGSAVRVSCTSFSQTNPDGSTTRGGKWTVLSICSGENDKCYQYQEPNSLGQCNLLARCGPENPCYGQETFCSTYPYEPPSGRITNEDAIFRCVEINGRTCKEWQRFCIEYGCSALPDDPNKAQCNSPPQIPEGPVDTIK